MLKPVFVSTLVVVSLATAVTAGPRRSTRVARPVLASMNLSPRGDFVRRIPSREFTPDRTPTEISYALSAPGVVSTVGYRPSDGHRLQTYEVNQATALGFSQTTASVGASVGYRF